MRHVFIALLAANLGYGVWAAMRHAPSARSHHITPAPAYGFSLSLVQESVTADFGLPQFEASLPDETGYLIANGSSADSSTVQTSERIDESLEMLTAQQGLPSPSPIVNSPAPAQPQDDGLRPGEDDDSDVSRALMAMSCLRVGPFATSQEASRMLGILAAHIDEADIASEVAPDHKVFWVHLPPYTSRAQAKNQVRSLQAQGIDSFVIDEPGPLKNGVSLGVFRDGDASRDMQRRMADAGLPAAIHQAQRYRSRYHIEAVATERDSSKIQATLRDVASSATIVVMDCAAVAPREAPN